MFEDFLFKLGLLKASKAGKLKKADKANKENKPNKAGKLPTTGDVAGKQNLNFNKTPAERAVKFNDCPRTRSAKNYWSNDYFRPSDFGCESAGKYTGFK